MSKLYSLLRNTLAKTTSSLSKQPARTTSKGKYAKYQSKHPARAIRSFAPVRAS